MGKVMISGVAPQMNVPIALPPIGTALNDMTWEQIRDISDAGKSTDYFNVGDTKNITLDGVSYPVQIIGFNHDTKTAGGNAGITFQMVDCMNTPASMGSSNSGGWTNNPMRTSTLAGIFNKLPTALQNAIKSVNKLTSAGSQSSTINTTSDKLFLLSEVEVYGGLGYSKSGEGSQYSFYNAGNSKVKKVNGSASDWWHRSPHGGRDESFCLTGSSGGVSWDVCGNTKGVSFAFCV